MTGLIISVAAIQSAALVVGAGSAGASAGGSTAAYTCSGGDIPAGTYGSMAISGVCYTPSGNVIVTGNLTVDPGALLDAVTPGDPTSGTPVVPAVLDVGGNVKVGSGAVLLLGCSPNIACGSPPGITYDVIGGNLVADRAQGVVVHSADVEGSVSVLGGGGGTAAESCKAQKPGKPTITSLEPWSLDPSLDFTPVYTDFEDSTIGGSLNVTGLTSCWLGTLRNFIGRDATFSVNTMGDPDAMEIGNNVIQGNFTCRANKPAPQFGDSGAAPDIVGGRASGQCGFGVTRPNPAPEAKQGPGIPEHISVKMSSLRTYHGVQRSVVKASLPPVTTAAGDTIVAQLENFFLSGTGLVGSGRYNKKQPPGSTGEAALGTIYPNGTAKFTIYETCACNFDGQTGTVGIRAYAVSTKSGITTGDFVIDTGGGAAPGSLTTLAGFGTFTSVGAPKNSVKITEHLAIT